MKNVKFNNNLILIRTLQKDINNLQAKIHDINTLMIIILVILVSLLIGFTVLAIQSYNG